MIINLSTQIIIDQIIVCSLLDDDGDVRYCCRVKKDKNAMRDGEWTANHQPKQNNHQTINIIILCSVLLFSLACRDNRYRAAGRRSP